MTNHLAESRSLYLQKYAENPINWWYWCDKALNIAQSENKPIFLSIGYSSCHWCTVMEGEAFSDNAIAQRQPSADQAKPGTSWSRQNRGAARPAERISSRSQNILTVILCRSK